MIELKTIDGDTIYINFEYQGIPEYLPIETFELRPEPSYKKEVEEIKKGYYNRKWAEKANVCVLLQEQIRESTGK